MTSKDGSREMRRLLLRAEGGCATWELTTEGASAYGAKRHRLSSEERAQFRELCSELRFFHCADALWGANEEEDEELNVAVTQRRKEGWRLDRRLHELPLAPSRESVPLSKLSELEVLRLCLWGTQYFYETNAADLPRFSTTYRAGDTEVETFDLTTCKQQLRKCFMTVDQAVSRTVQAASADGLETLEAGCLVAGVVRRKDGAEWPANQ